MPAKNQNCIVKFARSVLSWPGRHAQYVRNYRCLRSRGFSKGVSQWLARDPNCRAARLLLEIAARHRSSARALSGSTNKASSPIAKTRARHG